MSFYFVIGGETDEWELGTEFPHRQIPTYTQITAVAADGKELLWVRDNFLNLPDVVEDREGLRCPTVIWYGDHAKFLYTCLVSMNPS